MVEGLIIKESLKVKQGVVVMFVSPDNRVMVFSGDEENNTKTGEMVMGFSQGISRSVHGFELPGGMVKKYESYEDAIVREVGEEVRFDVNEMVCTGRLRKVGDEKLLQERSGETSKFDVKIFRMKLSWDEVKAMLDGLLEKKSSKLLSKQEISKKSLKYLRERDRMILKKYATILS